MKITDIQVFNFSRQAEGPNDTVLTIPEFGANVAIDDEFMIQWGSNVGWSIPDADEACWNNKAEQDKASEKYDGQELADTLGALEMVQELIADENFDN